MYLLIIRNNNIHLVRMVLNLILSLGSIVEPSLYMDVVLFSSRSFRKHLRVRESEGEAREQVQRARKKK